MQWKSKFFFWSGTVTSIKEHHKLTGLDKSTTLRKSIGPKHQISEDKVSQVTKIFEQEYENSFEINVDKGKLVNISSREALDDGIT